MYHRLGVKFRSEVNWLDPFLDQLAEVAPYLFFESVGAAVPRAPPFSPGWWSTNSI